MATRRPRPYACLDIHLFEDPAVQGLSPRTQVFFIECILASVRLQTDGQIGNNLAASLGGNHYMRYRDRLVEAGLASHEDSGIRLKSFLRWNLSKKQWLQRRAKERIRKRRYRRGSHVPQDEREMSRGDGDAGVLLTDELLRSSQRAGAQERPAAPQEETDVERVARYLKAIEEAGDLDLLYMTRLAIKRDVREGRIETAYDRGRLSEAMQAKARELGWTPGMDGPEEDETGDGELS